jgi:hypothetical protein
VTLSPLEAAVHRVLRGVEVGERLARRHPDRVEARYREERGVHIDADERRSLNIAIARVHDGTSPIQNAAPYEAAADDALSPDTRLALGDDT